MFPSFLTLCVAPQCCVVGPSLRIERVPEARRVGATLIDRFSPDKISYLHSYNILHAFSHHFLLWLLRQGVPERPSLIETRFPTSVHIKILDFW